MVLVSEHRHWDFIKSLDAGLQKFEKEESNNNDATMLVAELKDDFTALRKVFTEYHNALQQLQMTVGKYAQVQKRARIKLRYLQVHHTKMFKTHA